MKILRCISLLCLCCLLGCSWVKPKWFTRSRPPKTEEQRLEAVQFVESGKILDADRLRQGGKLVIVPFKAGAGVEANNDLDKISLMIVKGAAQAFKNQSPHFEILLSDNAQDADFVIEGHVTGIKKRSKMKKWMPGRHWRSVSVEGKMIDQTTGDTILIFKDKKETRKETEDHLQLGLGIGEDVGRFILSGVE